MNALIWHYPRCSKSRQTLALLEEAGAAIEVRLYQEDPPDLETLKKAVQELQLSPQALVRKKDAYFKELAIDESTMSDDDWLDLLTEHPRLIERPIVFTEKGARIGRPPESVKEIL